MRVLACTICARRQETAPAARRLLKVASACVADVTPDFAQANACIYNPAKPPFREVM
ncbi:hypothetical protein V1278_001715 [Bradyrhizobium sp. AZCC 1577]